MSEQLKPCPFCGGEPVTMHDPGVDGTIVCLGCGIGFDRLGASCQIDRQVKLWNTRTEAKRCL